MIHSVVQTTPGRGVIAAKASFPNRAAMMTSYCYDKLLLLSPRTWLGVIQHMRSSPFIQFRVEQIIQSFLGILIPLLVLSTAKLLGAGIDERRALYGLSLISPWTYANLQDSATPVQQIIQTCQFWKAGRQDSLPSALDCFAERVASGRCQPFGRYDVFFPTTTTATTRTTTENNELVQHATLLLPGALISHTAYTEVAAKLSDEGICVVTVSMEPSRMATYHLGADAHRMKRIMRHVSTLIALRQTSKLILWSIGGHSMGSFAAMRLAKELNDDDDGTTMPISHLFLWGAADFPNTRTDLRNSTLPVLVLQGSNDVLCRMTASQLNEFKSDFPLQTTRYQTIDGAAHNWFASVQEGDPEFVGHASISMKEQQNEAVARTAAFLLGGEGGTNWRD